MAKNDMVKIKSHLTIPQDVLEQIDGLVGKRKRSKFITEATKKELKRLKLQGALERAAGIWKDEDYPELKEKGTYQWVRDLREEEEKRWWIALRRKNVNQMLTKF